MKNLPDISREARKKILTMIHRGGTSHIASNFSVIDIATSLYAQLKPEDEVVWSKGWAAATIYYFLVQRGELDSKALEEFPNHPYLGLAETSVPGVRVSGGSMGHGLPVAVGIALAKKLKGESGRVFCIMSDGELNEGTTWEAAMLASHHKLDNLTVLVDANKWQAMGRTKDVIDLEPIENRWLGFGWASHTIDGHDFIDLTNALSYDQYSPQAIVCNTVKGKGVSFFEDHLLYHYKHVEKDEYERAMQELNHA